MIAEIKAPKSTKVLGFPAWPSWTPRPCRFAALEPGHDGVDDVGREGQDQAAEGQGDDQADRDDDHVAAHQKVLEALHALSSDSLLRTAPGMAARCPRVGPAAPPGQVLTAPGVPARKRGALPVVTHRDSFREAPRGDGARLGRRDQTRRTIPVIMTGRKRFGLSGLLSRGDSVTGA